MCAPPRGVHHYSCSSDIAGTLNGRGTGSKSARVSAPRRPLGVCRGILPAGCSAWLRRGAGSFARAYGHASQSRRPTGPAPQPPASGDAAVPRNPHPSPSRLLQVPTSPSPGLGAPTMARGSGGARLLLAGATLLLLAAASGAAAQGEFGERAYASTIDVNTEAEAEVAAQMIRAFVSVSKEINTGKEDPLVFAAAPANVTGVNAASIQAKVGPAPAAHARLACATLLCSPVFRLPHSCLYIPPPARSPATRPLPFPHAGVCQCARHLAAGCDQCAHQQGPEAQKVQPLRPGPLLPGGLPYAACTAGGKKSRSAALRCFLAWFAAQLCCCFNCHPCPPACLPFCLPAPLQIPKDPIGTVSSSSLLRMPAATWRHTLGMPAPHT